VDTDGESSTGSRALTGQVTEQLPSALYRVKLDGGGLVTAHIADRLDRNFVRVLVGDRVRIELSPADSSRGRIVERIP
jgi:translation initiation factor IF-1